MTLNKRCDTKDFLCGLLLMFGYLQTNADEVSRTSLALRAAESAKDQRTADHHHHQRDSLVSVESTTSADSVRTNIARSAFTPVAVSPALAGNQITKVSSPY